MIISHKLKVIYIKLDKVAGSSFEIALSKYCGPDDILTPILPEGKIWESMGYYRGAQNYEHLKKKAQYTPHMAALNVKKRIPKDVWDNYLKIATIRCLYDVYISFYHFTKHSFQQHKKRTPEKNFEAFVIKDKRITRHLRGLHEEGKILIDFLIRYENLDQDIKELEVKIDCPGLLRTFQSITAKKNIHPKDSASSCQTYSKYPNAKLIIDQRCSELAEEYEFFQKYWPMYKSKLEKDIEEYQATQT